MSMKYFNADSAQRTSPYYFKATNNLQVYLPSCSSDEFSGTRGRSSTTGNLFFHGRHIFSSLLRDLVSRFELAKAKDIVLIGSGKAKFFHWQKSIREGLCVQSPVKR